MDWVLNNWYITFIVIIALGLVIYKLLRFPKKEQIIKIKEWLLIAVIQAEKELGNGTGQIKLRYVYDLFIHSFPTAAKFISFKLFSNLVDEALDTLNNLLVTNDKINNIIKNKKLP